MDFYLGFVCICNILVHPPSLQVQISDFKSISLRGFSRSESHPHSVQVGRRLPPSPLVRPLRRILVTLVLKPILPLLKEDVLEKDTRPRDPAVDELVQQLVSPAGLVFVVLKHCLGDDSRAHGDQVPVPLAVAEVSRAAVDLALVPELGPAGQGVPDLCITLKACVDDVTGDKLFENV